MGKTVTIGSVSHGTMREEDLIPSFAWELKYNTPDGAERFAKLLAECDAWEAMQTDDSDQSEETDQGSYDLVADLVDALNEYAPAYCYFGSHEGDGSDYGFWPSWDSINELPKVSDPSEVDGMNEDCVFVNDHGNVTVYAADGSVIWDCV